MFCRVAETGHFLNIAMLKISQKLASFPDLLRVDLMTRSVVIP
jgi:hypothetical protein